jgi:hypothetical protein
MTEIVILLPTGRLVEGSLYKGSTTDMDKNPLVFKSGKNAGQPRTSWYIGVAIEKKGETHWNQTWWGKQIWEIGQNSFPNGAARSNTFAWKIVDGDSDVPNKKGSIPRDKVGFPGHWILKLSQSFAPPIVNRDGSQYLIEEDYVKAGYYIQVQISCEGNNSQQQPGVYLNPKMVSFQAYGEVINLGVDPKDIGFGEEPLPAGASLAPVASVTPAPEYNHAVDISNTHVIQPNVAPAPYHEILTPPSPPSQPPVPQRRMTEKAKGLSYDQYLAAGWNDTQLIQAGMMEV